MPSDPRKRQKQQERRAAKRKAKQHQLTRQKHAGLPERLAGAAGFPVLHSWATGDLWDQGMGWVCLSRMLPNGSVAFALFLVDRFCLGVKDAVADVTSRFEYDSRIVRKARSGSALRELTPEVARKLVESAVAYAESLGLHAHADYHKAKLLFGAIQASEAPPPVEFGKDGKPFFIAGPYDTPERCRHILRTLEEHCGPGGFDYLIPVASKASAIFPEEVGADRNLPLEFEEEEGVDDGPS
jgi:hypothetical protein